jgi:transposase InsO family protein
MSSTLGVQSVIASAFCVLDRYMSERFGRLRSTRGEGASGVSAHFIPTHTTINTEGTALLFLKEVWKHHGTPRAVVSDRGPQFVAAFTHELYTLLGIKLVMSTAYHPQTDGQTERVNQELEGYLPQVNNRTIGMDSCPWASFHTTTMYTRRLSRPPSWLILGDTLTWALSRSSHALN